MSSAGLGVCLPAAPAVRSWELSANSLTHMCLFEGTDTMALAAWGGARQTGSHTLFSVCPREAEVERVWVAGCTVGPQEPGGLPRRGGHWPQP